LPCGRPEAPKEVTPGARVAQPALHATRDLSETGLTLEAFRRQRSPADPAYGPQISAQRFIAIAVELCASIAAVVIVGPAQSFA
jgi:hypothetical protein